MQAMLVDSIRPGDWIYEIKFDGYRAVALRSGDETRILSRNDKDLGRKFPEVKARLRHSLFKTRSLMAKLSHWTTKADHPFSNCKDSTWGL
jgi:ATP-dependent DNA ligase